MTQVKPSTAGNRPRECLACMRTPWKSVRIKNIKVLFACIYLSILKNPIGLELCGLKYFNDQTPGTSIIIRKNSLCSLRLQEQFYLRCGQLIQGTPWVVELRPRLRLGWPRGGQGLGRRWEWGLAWNLSSSPLVGADTKKTCNAVAYSKSCASLTLTHRFVISMS